MCVRISTKLHLDEPPSDSLPRLNFLLLYSWRARRRLYRHIQSPGLHDFLLITTTTRLFTMLCSVSSFDHTCTHISGKVSRGLITSLGSQMKARKCTHQCSAQLVSEYHANSKTIHTHYTKVYPSHLFSITEFPTTTHATPHRQFLTVYYHDHL